MASIVGIDLGTTNSVIAKLDKAGRPTIVYNDDGDNLTPSAVYFENERNVQVGKEAKRLAGLGNASAFLEFKREMGTKKTYEAFGKEYTPTDLSGFVLKKLKEERENSIPEIREVVVTIPANFANEAREATLEAAKVAGLDVKYIINEPTAAALYYAFHSGEKLNGFYAVYDLGGGTFDISIIELKGYDVKVIASEGVQKLGGKDFDEILFKVVAEKYKAETGEALDPQEMDFNVLVAEEEKKRLSKRESIGISIRGGRAGSTKLTVTREEFEKAISPLVAQAEMLCESALDESKLKAKAIKEVFLVGGSTRVPFVQQSVESVFGKKPTSIVNPDEVVALGAALYSAYITDRENLNVVQLKTLENLKVQDIASHYFGTISLGFSQEKGQYGDQVSIIIPKGEKIPCSITEKFYTISDNQTAVDCMITQSSSRETDPRFVKIIWNGKLTLPPNRPAGQEVEITYVYDLNQTMKCSFRDMTSGNETTIDLSIEAKGNGERLEIDKFLIE